MFGFIADILTSITSILFPIFASYKALRSSDPAALAPWLMYWVTLSLFLLVENQFYFILYWVPFYSWMRLGLHLYLVAPGKQGSVWIYQTYIHPFLEEHERQIDRMISDGHARAKQMGLGAVQQLVEYVQVQFMGKEPKRPTPPNSRNVSYSTALLSRFNMPNARGGMPAGLAGVGATDLFNLLGKTMSQNTHPTSDTRDAQARDLADSGSIIPPNLSGAERQDYVNTQRDRLHTLLKAFDAEAYASPGDAGHSSARSPPPREPTSRKGYLSSVGDEFLQRSKSESEFEDLAYETMPDPDNFRPRSRDDRHDRDDREHRRPAPTKQGSGWGSFIWGNYGERDSAVDHRKDR